MILRTDRNTTALPEKTLDECLSKTIQQGFTETFRVAGDRLIGIRPGYFYTSDQVSIVHYFRFEAHSHAQDSTILYMIETKDGRKGTLIDAYDVYADSMTSDFVNEMACSQLKPRTVSH